MKKITFLFTIACAMLLVIACSDDRDSNPVVQQPTSFVLNEPALAGNTYDLANSSAITVSCQQPDYGYTALVSYYAQVSLDNTWDDAIYADDGETVITAATYAQIEGSYTECMIDIDASQVNRAVLTVGAWDSEAAFPTQPISIYLRLKAALTSGYECYSNSVILTVKAYYTELSDATPEMWYLTGQCIGDGSWSVDYSSLGVGLVPMSHVEGYEYSATTGQGELTYTGYFPAGQGFKLIRDPGSWEYQWGNSGGDGIDSPVKNDGGSSNLAVPADGFYTITLDTAADILTIEQAADQTYYSQMLISGAFNDWSTDEQMAAVNTTTGINNVWRYNLGSEEDTELKFLVDSSWSPNWGASDFPYGFGVNNGANIPVAAGDYIIIFNDITGFYYFFNANE